MWSEVHLEITYNRIRSLVLRRDDEHWIDDRVDVRSQAWNRRNGFARHWATDDSRSDLTVSLDCCCGMLPSSVVLDSFAHSSRSDFSGKTKEIDSAVALSWKEESLHTGEGNVLTSKFNCLTRKEDEPLFFHYASIGSLTPIVYSNGIVSFHEQFQEIVRQFGIASYDFL